QLAALFRAHAAAIRNKTAVTAADLAEAADVGAELTTRLKPERARRDEKAKGALAEQMEQRDRTWTLLWLRHRELRRAGMWLWVDEVDAHVPPLQAYEGRTRKLKTPASDAPPPKTVTG